MRLKMTFVDEFNALSDRLIHGEISGAEFCAIATDRFGYDRSEANRIMRQLRAKYTDAEFWIANGLAEKHLGWSEKQLVLCADAPSKAGGSI
jgi:hypothetical protein